MTDPSVDKNEPMTDRSVGKKEQRVVAPKIIDKAQKRAELIEAAKAVQKRAHAPYSKFLVGAALLSTDGEVFTGCNVENCTFGLTTCAEQVAFLKAVSEGTKSFERIVIYTEAEPPAAPCGLCRQMMVEFCDDLRITLVNHEGRVEHCQLSEIMPHAFRPSDLEEATD